MYAALAAAAPVHWTAPAGCPHRATVEPSIERTLTAEPAEAQTREDGGTLRVVVTRPFGTFRRELDTDRCEAAAEAAPLVVGLLISQSEDDDEPEPEPNVRTSTRRDKSECVLGTGAGGVFNPDALPWIADRAFASRGSAQLAGHSPIFGPPGMATRATH